MAVALIALVSCKAQSTIVGTAKFSTGRLHMLNEFFFLLDDKGHFFYSSWGKYSEGRYEIVGKDKIRLQSERIQFSQKHEEDQFYFDMSNSIVKYSTNEIQYNGYRFIKVKTR